MSLRRIFAVIALVFCLGAVTVPTASALPTVNSPVKAPPAACAEINTVYLMAVLPVLLLPVVPIPVTVPLVSVISAGEILGIVSPYVRNGLDIVCS